MTDDTVALFTLASAQTCEKCFELHYTSLLIEALLCDMWLYEALIYTFFSYTLKQPINSIQWKQTFHINIILNPY